MKRNMGAPPSFIPVDSAVPTKYKHAGVNGDMLRIRRICSTTSYVNLHDSLLRREYYTLGYGRIKEIMEKRIKELEEEFDRDYNRISKEKSKDGLVYGATCIMEAGAGTHAIVKYFIKKSRNNGSRMPMLVPGMKLGTLLHTRKRYFSKLRKL